MALYMPPDTGLLKYRFLETGKTDELLCTMGIRYVGAETLPDHWPDIAWAASDAWKVCFPNGYCSNTMSFLGTEIVIGNGYNPPESKVTYNEGVPYVGTQSMQAPPLNCAAIVRKKTAKIGKKYRGRFYIPSGYMNETHISAVGVISNTTLTNLTSGAAGLIDAFESNDCQMVLFHTAAGPSSLDPTVVTSLEVATTIGTQRRRMR